MSINHSDAPQDGDRLRFYQESVDGVFEDKFFDVVFGNPDPQPFRIDWLTEGVSEIDLYFGQGLTEEEIGKLGHDRREIEVIARVTTNDPQKLAGLRAIKAAGVFEGFAILDFDFMEEYEKSTDRMNRNVFFRIPHPCSYKDIRKAFYKFAAVLEKAGFRNNGHIVFDWMDAVNMNEFSFAEHDASFQVERMQEIEKAQEEAAAQGNGIDVTQAKQALENIFRMGG